MRALFTLIMLILISSYINISLRNRLAQKEITLEMSNNEILCDSKYARNYPICTNFTKEKLPLVRL
jgi:hypothetical protein